MNPLVRPLLAVGLAAGSLLAAAPAEAGCYGTREIAYACVTLPEVREGEITQCVYTGGDTCEEVRIPFVTVTGGVWATCTTGSWIPTTALDDPCEQVSRMLGPGG